MSPLSPSGPLAGRRIVVTRPDGGGTLAEMLRAAGATVLDLPATRIEPVPAVEAAARLSALAQYDWVVLTSRNAVAFYRQHARAAGVADALPTRRYAVVGTSTAEALRDAGLVPTVVPARFDAEGVAEAMCARPDVSGARVLYATAEGARDVIPAALREAGATVDVVPLYRSVVNADATDAMRRAADEGVDLVVCTAPSTVDAWAAAVGEHFARIPVASIGPVTSAAVRKLGGTVGTEADPATAEGLGNAVRRYFTGQ